MLLSGRRNDMDSVRWSRSPVHFFKIIVSHITPYSRLMIPRKFISECEYDFGDSVYLRAPAGSVWKVQVERNSGEVWLGHGWSEFAANYSICFGHFLVFRYEGNSHFHVIILDNSATEIEYPLTTCIEQTYHNKGYRTRRELDTTSDNVGSMEELRNCPRLSKKRKSVSACAEASYQVRDLKTKVQEKVSRTLNKTMRIEDTDDASDNTCDLQVSIKSKEIHLDDSLKEDRGKGGKILIPVTSEAENARVLASAKAFKSKNPFFIVKIQPSHISGQFIPTVPKSFVTKYITQDHRNVILQVSDGRDWPVKCNVYCSNAKFTGGWRIFANENSLRVGDVCVFELINFSGNFLKVFIFRAAKGGYQTRKELVMANNLVGSMEEFVNCHQAMDALFMPNLMPSNGGNRLLCKTSEADKARALPLAKAFKSENPFFVVKMQPSYVDAKLNLTVPKKFVTKYITQDRDNVILRVSDGRTWPVKCSVYGTNGKINIGWSIFAKENNLAVGDVCVFELISSSKKLPNVIIFRAARGLGF